MNSQQSGLRFLPPPFHHPGWRGHPHHEFLSQKISPSCLYAAKRKDQESSYLEFEAEKFPPAPQADVPPLPGLETKKPAFLARHGGPPLPTFAPSSLQQPSLTIFPSPPSCQGLTSAAPNGKLQGGSPSSSSSDFTQKRDYEVSILLKPSHGLGESKGGEEDEEEDEEEEEKEEEEEDKHFIPKTPSLGLSKCDKTSQVGLTQENFPYAVGLLRRRL
ncbi:homeobox protein Hox-B9 isoform X3 [Hemicordylus capensis]|uniref:homeobox protein Hox-B9 isoform X3 n=1 Tax=Hemicordylus capensis TaxID=884348 RepID=UPI0023039BE5|nr:homeobox protein Hox-B9 isoform X3 [Hemicordylus capensis]